MADHSKATTERSYKEFAEVDDPDTETMVGAAVAWMCPHHGDLVETFLEDHESRGRFVRCRGFAPALVSDRSLAS